MKQVLKYSSSYWTGACHPQANGLVESRIRSIKEILLNILEGKDKNWVACLNGVLFAHQTTILRSTAYSPFCVLYPKLPVDVSCGFKPSETCTLDEEYVGNVEQDMQVIREKCQINDEVNSKKVQAWKQQKKKRKKVNRR